MHIRAIRPDEIDRFAAFHPDESAAAQTRAYLARQLDAGHTRLAWCFVAEEGEQFLGRVAYWGLAGATLPDAIALLHAPERAGFEPTGAHWDYQRPLHTSP